MKRTLLYMVKLGKNEPHETPPVRLDSNSRVSIHHCQWVRQLITSVLMHSALHFVFGMGRAQSPAPGQTHSPVYHVPDLTCNSVQASPKIELHVLESGWPDIICVNICSAAAPRGTSRHRYAGTSCPAPKTRKYENVPAFLYRPADLPLTL